MPVPLRAVLRLKKLNKGLTGAGMETSERALRERIVWRGERFPVGVSGPPGLHLIVEEVS